jgi:hypothetical protein
VLSCVAVPGQQVISAGGGAGWMGEACRGGGKAAGRAAGCGCEARLDVGVGVGVGAPATEHRGPESAVDAKLNRQTNSTVNLFATHR